MPTVLLHSFFYFCYVLDVGNDPPRSVIGVLFNPKLMEFISFADMNLDDSSVILILTLMIC
jgi:hypothetical protein